MTWDLQQLNDLLSQDSMWSVKLENDCLFITNLDGLDAYLAVSGAQIVVESILFSCDSVTDTAALNKEILKTHQIFPLTTIGIAAIQDEEYYVAFGALSSQSKKASIMIEIETLFNNVASFLEAYEDFLK